MNDDIVTRLREAEQMARNSQLDVDDVGDLINWCADTIEQLFVEINGWRGLCERFAKSDPRFEAFGLYFKLVEL